MVHKNLIEVLLPTAIDSWLERTATVGLRLSPTEAVIVHLSDGSAEIIEVDVSDSKAASSFPMCPQTGRLRLSSRFAMNALSL
jgi:hypothetical protein